ncbi:hypothetical protein Gotur_006372, partial [Gossypium turneri]
MDRYFIDLMLEQLNKGNRFDDHVFSKTAWMNMNSSFNERFKFEYEMDVLKNRHKTLRNLYKAVKNLLNQKGFNWDSTRQMVIAENKIWDEYIKVQCFTYLMILRVFLHCRILRVFLFTG